MADKKVRFINLNNQILTLGGDGILSFPDIATMASEPIANLQNGAIGWVDSEQKYFQWLDTNEISEMGRWKELIFGSDFQISDPTTSADDEHYRGRVVQYIGEDDLTTGFRKGYFYESRIETTLTYVETVCTETSTGTYYILRDGEYLEVVLLGDGTTFDPDETYYKKQDVEVYGWFYINALRVDTELADTDYAIANKTVKAKFDEVIQDYTDKNDELREYVDNDLTTSLQQYTDDKIDDSEEEVFEDKTWSSSKINTKFEEVAQTITDGNEALTEYVDTTLEGYEKKFVECTFEEYKQMETDGTVESDVDYIITTNESGTLLSDLDTNHGDSEISTYEVIETLKSDVDKKAEILDSEKNDVNTWSSSMIASQISNATDIKRNDVIGANATKETGWNLAQGESHFYGRLLQLDGHLGSKSSTFSFLLFVKANYDSPTTVYVTQLAGMDDDRSNIAHTTYFELGVSSSGNLTITNKSAVTASYRFI